MWENQNQSIPDLLITPLDWFQARLGSRGELLIEAADHNTETKRTNKNHRTKREQTNRRWTLWTHSTLQKHAHRQFLGVSVKGCIICIFTHMLLASRQVSQTSSFGSTVTDQVVSLLLTEPSGGDMKSTVSRLNPNLCGLCFTAAVPSVPLLYELHHWVHVI